MQLVFNELSLHNVSTNIADGKKSIEKFIKTYTVLVKKDVGFSREIITPVDLNDIEISKGYYAAKWRNSQSVDRDLQSRFKRICDLQKIETYNDDMSEITYEKHSGIGLLVAYQNELPLISIPNDARWDKYFIKCEYYNLETNEANSVQLQNLSSERIIEENKADILKMLQNDLSLYLSQDELLKSINELFPSLIFHQNALNQIENQLEKQHIPVVIKKLKQLESYFKIWDGGEFDRSQFPNKCISPQSTETLKRFQTEHTFRFDDETIIVSFHMRYTGNIPGRIYFYPDDKLKKARICSLTTKLPTVSNPKSRIN